MLHSRRDCHSYSTYIPGTYSYWFLRLLVLALRKKQVVDVYLPRAVTIQVVEAEGSEP